MRAMDDKTPIELAADCVGGIYKLAPLLGKTPQAVYKWKTAGIPADEIVKIEALTGFPREKLRPDLYRQSVA